MQIATSKMLALIGWHDFRFIQGFNGRDFTWLLIGVLLTVATFEILARRRRAGFRSQRIDGKYIEYQT